LEYKLNSVGVWKRCLRLWYGSNSGNINCPIPWPIDIALSGGVPLESGSIYCCEP
jgi:hypothetical protein